MGIQNLLPFLANSTRDAHISEFENEFVAIDAYCWLHKGIYSCAFELAMKKPTQKYVTYCMRYIEMLLHFKVKPILVFDGRQLFSKSETEKKRREERKKKYEKGKELMRAGKTTDGRKLLGESVDVTHELALNLIRECRQKNIDCIIAPYEADAQLAFFSIRNIVKCVITEDSDLLAYGCEKVMFKMDTSGRGKLIDKSEIHFSLNITPEEFSEDIFRYMCILAGCDYLPSLPSIGPVFALKFVKMLKGNDIYDALPKLPIYVNKLNVKVTTEYIEQFKIADNTFKHQLVYDPFLRKQVPLRLAKNDDDIVGTKLPEDLAFQLAVGNIDPNTMKKVDHFDPDKSCTGFNILWKTDLLPNTISRQSLFNSLQTIRETKKRQREYLESDVVQPVTKDLKKQRIPLSIKTNKHLFIKNSNQKVPENGFIFDPKIPNNKKNDSKLVDKSNLLESRYFSWEISKGRDKRPIESLYDKRKNESYEDYLRRLYNEYFPVDENKVEEPEAKKEECYCNSQTEISVLVDFCSACKKCCECCSCNKDIQVSSNQHLNECIKNFEEFKESGQKSQHFLLNELNKNQSEIAPNGNLLEKGDKTVEDKEEEDKSKNISPSQNLSTNFAKILSKFDSLENDNSASKVDEKKNSDVFCDYDNERVRSPSPVFKIQKESRILSKNSRLGNVSDTAGTPTSIYFSSVSSRSSAESNSKVIPKTAQINSHQKMPSVRNFNSVPAKTGKIQSKSSSVNKTLFQFGFKKQRRSENDLQVP